MSDAQLQAFRDLAEQMAGPEPHNWQWEGPYMSTRMYGITEKRALAYVQRFGGEARQMIEVIVERGGKVVDRVQLSTPEDVAAFIVADSQEKQS